MKQLYKAGNEHLMPNVAVYNAAMNACAFTRDGIEGIHESSRVMEIAHSILKEMEQSEHVNPDQVTYGTFFKVCANQMTDCSSRQKVIEILFKKCAKEGQVGNLVMQQMRSMADDELYAHLIGRSPEEEITLDDLPSDWTRNVVEGKWRRRRNLY